MARDPFTPFIYLSLVIAAMRHRIRYREALISLQLGGIGSAEKQRTTCKREGK